MYDEVLHEHLWNGVKFLYFMVLKLQKCVYAYSSPYGIYYIKNIHINIANKQANVQRGLHSINLFVFNPNSFVYSCGKSWIFNLLI